MRMAAAMSVMEIIATTGSSEKQFVLVFQSGEEIISGLMKFVREYGLHACQFSAIGGFSDVTLGFFDLNTKEYRKNSIQEQVEVVSLAGNVTLAEGKYKVHSHAVVAKSDGSAYGGHLLEGHVKPTLEVMMGELSVQIIRKKDTSTGLDLMTSSTVPGSMQAALKAAIAFNDSHNHATITPDFPMYIEIENLHGILTDIIRSCLKGWARVEFQNLAQ